MRHAADDPVDPDDPRVLAAWTHRVIEELAPGQPSTAKPSNAAGWFIAHSEMVDAWHRLTAAAVEPSFGIHFAERWSFALVEPLVRLLASAPTLGDAVEAYASAAALLDGGALVDVTRDGDAITVACGPPAGQRPWPRHLAESVIAGFVHVARVCVRGDFRLAGVSFMHAAPEHADDIRRWFATDITWNAARNAAWATDAAALAMWSSNPDAFLDVQRRAADLVERVAPVDDVVAEIREVLRRDGAIQRCSLESLAASLGTSVRTLQRRLRAAGTSFRVVVDRMRWELISDCPDEKRLALAHALGFRDDSALRKFLRRAPA